MENWNRKLRALSAIISLEMFNRFEKINTILVQSRKQKLTLNYVFERTEKNIRLYTKPIWKTYLSSYNVFKHWSRIYITNQGGRMITEKIEEKTLIVEETEGRCRQPKF